MRPEVRAMVNFGRVNLTEARLRPERPFDAIFCRNVMIYFDKPTQGQVLLALRAADEAGRAAVRGTFRRTLRTCTQAFRLRGPEVWMSCRVTDAATAASRARDVQERGGGMGSGLPIASNLYFDNHFQSRGVKLLPNEFYTTRAKTWCSSCRARLVRGGCIQRPHGGYWRHESLQCFRPDDGADVVASLVRTRCATAPTRWKCSSTNSSRRSGRRERASKRR